MTSSHRNGGWRYGTGPRAVVAAVILVAVLASVTLHLADEGNDADAGGTGSQSTIRYYEASDSNVPLKQWVVKSWIGAGWSEPLNWDGMSFPDGTRIHLSVVNEPPSGKMYAFTITRDSDRTHTLGYISGEGDYTIAEDAVITCRTCDLSETTSDYSVVRYGSGLTVTAHPGGSGAVGTAGHSNRWYGVTDVIFEGDVKRIGSSLFSANITLKEVTIPATVETIDSMAFYGCTGLERITFLGTPDAIGMAAFLNCTSLKEVVFSGTGTCRIDPYAFYGCTGLKTIDLSRAGGIAASAFYGCTGLRSIDLTGIGMSGAYGDVAEGAFSGCTGLTAAIADKPLNQNAFNGSGLEHPEAMVGNSRFAALEDAVDFVPDGGTVRVCGAAEVDGISIAAGRILTLKLDPTDAGGTAFIGGTSSPVIENRGTLIIEGAGGISGSGTVLLNRGTMTVDGVSVSSSGTASGAVVNGWKDEPGGGSAVLRIAGGTFSGGSAAVENLLRGDLMIDGGAFYCSAGPALRDREKAVLNGGSFSSAAGSALSVEQTSETGSGIGELKVRGGTFSSASGRTAHLAVSGIDSRNVSKSIDMAMDAPEGYVWVEIGGGGARAPEAL